LLITVAYLLYTHFHRVPAKKKTGRRPAQSPEDSELKISLKDLIDTEMLGKDQDHVKTIDKADQSSATTSQIPEDKGGSGSAPTKPPTSDPVVSVEPAPIHNPKTDLPPTTRSEPKPPSSLVEPSSKTSESESTRKQTEAKPKSKELGKYHVLYRREDKRWYVKREGSERILRVLDTQREAIAYATIKAITQNTAFVVHKQDGKIRKQ